MSASPAAAENSASDPKVTFRFCSECSNLLYPKEDKENHTLMFACRTCQYSMPAPSSRVSRHDVLSTAADTAGITQDVAQDPTVGDSDFVAPHRILGCCTLCGEIIVCVVCGQVLDDSSSHPDCPTKPICYAGFDDGLFDNDDANPGAYDTGLLTPSPSTPNNPYQHGFPHLYDEQLYNDDSYDGQACIERPSNATGPQMKEMEATTNGCAT